MADIFVSYAREDRGLVDELCEHLERLGYTTWYDPNMLSGGEWRRVIPTEIRKSRVLIVLWSDNSEGSIVVPQEVDKAIQFEKPIIALRVKGFDVERIPFGFGHMQTILNTAVPEIDKALREYVPKEQPPPATRTAKVTPASIFSAAFPVETLVDRNQTKEALTLLSSMSDVGRCIRFCGPTKSGKTVLINEALRDRNPIYVAGGMIHEVQSFYNHIAIGLDPEFSSVANEAFIFAKAVQAKRPIVIDDFHRIPATTRKAILRRLQPFLDKDISIILVSWTDIEGNTIANDPALQGRVLPPINISFWRNGDLEKIGQRGFKALNVRPSPFTLTVITHHSYNNPFLMHEHCQKVAEACGIITRAEHEKSIAITETQAISIFSGLCTPTRANFLHLIENKGAKKYELKTGHQTTVNGLIALGVRRMEPIHSIGMPFLAKRIRELLKDPGWVNAPEIDKCVQEFMTLLDKSPHKQTAVELSDGKLHIHPFFKRYLLWDFAPSKGFSYPDMTNYQDEMQF